MVRKDRPLFHKYSMMIIEDGTGIVGANSYATVEAFRAHHELRGEFVGFPDAEIVAALVKATDYIEAHYPASTVRLNPAQGLQWPASDATALPAPVVAATLILALYALNGPLTAPATRGIKSKTIKGDAGEIATVYDDAPADPYPAITAIMVPLMARGAGGGLIMGKLAR